MARLLVRNFSISLDGYAAGPDQSLEHPLGRGGEELHEWLFASTAAPGEVGGDAAEDAGIDARYAAEFNAGIGATIMGRNMFGPVRGAWGEEHWTGWWGDDPPYHHPTFVLTHHPRRPVVMHGGTTFHFVTDGIESALEQAVAAADGLDVALGGGASTVKAFLRAGLVDEMHVAIVPILLGGGVRLFDDAAALRESVDVEVVTSTSVAHLRLRRTTGHARITPRSASRG